MSTVGALGLSLLLVGGTSSERVGLKWEKSFEEALKKARATRRPVLIDFWAEWGGWCHRLDQTTYVDGLVVKMGEDFVSVKVDTEGGRQQQEIAERYDVTQLPTILFVSPAGRVLLTPLGPVAVAEAQWLSRVLGPRLTALTAATHLHESGQCLRHEHALLYSIINTVTDPILLTDADGRIMIANARAETLLATGEDQSEGRRRAVALKG